MYKLRLQLKSFMATSFKIFKTLSVRFRLLSFTKLLVEVHTSTFNIVCILCTHTNKHKIHLHAIATASVVLLGQVNVCSGNKIPVPVRLMLLELDMLAGCWYSIFSEYIFSNLIITLYGIINIHYSHHYIQFNIFKYTG